MVYYLKISQIWKKIRFFNIHTRKDSTRSLMKESEQVESLLWSFSTIKAYNEKHDEIILDPLIDKLINKINTLMSKYC